PVRDRRLGALVDVEQLLVDLLPGARADELDRHIHIRLVARQGDHVSSQLEDPDRLPHLEHEDLARARPEVPRLDDQLDGLWNGHEISGHLRMGDGYGATLLDLTAEDRYHAPGRGEHVPEPNGHEARARVALARGLDDPLRHRLRGTHHGAR